MAITRVSNVMFLILLAIGTLAGQNSEKSEPPVFKGGTEFVQVPVIAKLSGKHISGLKKEEFTLQQDGKVQVIGTFEEIHANGIGFKATAESGFGNSYKFASMPPQVVILAFDTVNTPVLDQAYFREEFQKYISGMKPEDPPIEFIVLT